MAHAEDWIAQLRQRMWQDAGLLRDRAGLQRASKQLQKMSESRPAGRGRRAVEARNLHTVAGVMVRAALGREESRGAHARLDFPHTSTKPKHSIVRGNHLRLEE